MKTAFYLRLSLSDGDLGKDGKNESNSIGNQRLLLCDFLKKHKNISDDVIEYIDDGYSGTDFERPAFQKMIMDMKKGLISVILVKDLSRFGRDYIGVGDYIEQIFPLYNVRLIAVNNSFDSESMKCGSEELNFAITNLINTFYCRDVSKKIKSAFHTKWKQGQLTSSDAPFGYKKVRVNGELKFEIDSESAKIVRRIFDFAIKGYNTATIACKLNTLNLPTPGVYKARTVEWRRERFITPESERLWTPAIVWKVLTREEYTGVLLMGKSRKVAFGSKMTKKTPKDEVFRMENSHPAIVSKEEYNAAQRAISHKRYGYKEQYRYALKGKVRCGNCRLLMQYDNNNGIESFKCGHGRAAGNHSACFKGSVSKLVIDGKVCVALFQLLTLFQRKGQKVEQSGVKNLKKEIENKKREIDVLNEKQFREYEIYTDGKISRDEYLNKKTEIAEQISKLQAELAKIESLSLKQSEEQNYLDEAVNDADDFILSGNFTEELVNKYIDAVYVYDDERIEVKFKNNEFIENTIEEFFEDVKQTYNGSQENLHITENLIQVQQVSDCQ